MTPVLSLIFGLTLGVILLTSVTVDAYTPRYLDEQMKINLKKKTYDTYKQHQRDFRPQVTKQPFDKSIGVLQGSVFQDIDDFTAQLQHRYDRQIDGNATMKITGVNYERTFKTSMNNGYAVFNFDLWNYTGKFRAEYTVQSGNDIFQYSKIFHVIKKTY